jgi:hypothetical protein
MLSDVKNALASQGISKVLIVDDLYDASPTIDHVPSAAWSFFFDDLKRQDRELIAGAFPGSDPDANRMQLVADPVFLAFLWNRRSASAVFAKLFDHFESETSKGRIALDKLEALLSTTLGLRTYTAGTRPLFAEGMHAGRMADGGDPKPKEEQAAAACGEKALSGATAGNDPNPAGLLVPSHEASTGPARETDDPGTGLGAKPTKDAPVEADPQLEGAPPPAVDGESCPSKQDSAEDSTPEEAADIVFMDLYLGAGQDAPEFEAAIARVRKLLERRKDRPPLVVLMSSSTRLREKVDDFRDRAELLGCQFRMLEKSDIYCPERVFDILFRLVVRYQDTLRLASFVETWRTVLTGVSDALLRRIRRLDLRDYANLQALVLDAEGERIGNYLIELYDRVFHYELEGDSRLLAAGRRLNEIDWSEFPPPHFLPAADAMEMLDNLMFHHPASIAADDPAALGDVFFVSLDKEPGISEVPKIDESSGEILALLLVTQACDLQRGSVGRLLFVPGIARPMDLRLHKRPDKLWTPVLRVDEKVFIVNWKPEVAPFTFTEEHFKQRVASGRCRRVRRFRTIYALQLQQEFSSALTRVGTIVGPPMRHTVAIKVYFRRGDQKVMLLHDFAVAPENAVAMVGRNGDGLVDLLALSPDAVESIRGSLLSLDPQLVQALPKTESKKWASAVGGRGLYRALEHGIAYNRGRRIRPLKGEDDILEILGPFATDAPPVDGEKSAIVGPLIIHIVPQPRPQSLADTTANEPRAEESAGTVSSTDAS